MLIFEETKKFPKEERYSLTDQIRRSSRAVCALIAEGYRKRRFPKSFALMMNNADAEVSETTVHLNFAVDCGYLSPIKYDEFIAKYKSIGKMLGKMTEEPEKFLPRATLSPLAVSISK
jgi:four helix bundle protein